MASDIRECLDKVKSGLSYQERTTLLKEYELSQKMHNFYANQLWQMGSILIGGSVSGLALVISREPRPSLIVFVFAVAVVVMGSVFLRTVQRFKAITFGHLVRCREIEACLGMRQHRYVERAGCKPFCVTRQDGKQENIGKIPSPTGYRLTQGMIIVVVILGIIVALLYSPLQL